MLYPVIKVKSKHRSVALKRHLGKYHNLLARRSFPSSLKHTNGNMLSTGPFREVLARKLGLARIAASEAIECCPALSWPGMNRDMTFRE